jgi:hypothetical protein
MNGEKQQKKRPYQFPGEDLSRFLIEWLNGPQNEKFSKWRDFIVGQHNVAFGGGEDADNKARERVGGLLADLKEVHRVAELLAMSKSPNDPLGWRTLEELTEKINRVLRGYRRHDALITNPPALKAGKFVRIFGNKGDEQPRAYFWGTVPDLTTTPPQELNAAQVVRELDGQNLLGKIITCAACGRWMYARKSSQSSHNTECRREKYKQQRSRNRKHSEFLAEMKARKASRRTK